MQTSPDPVIRALQRRQAEAEQLAAFLCMYASTAQAQEDRPSVSPLEHYSMLDAPTCGCVTCMDWEARREEFVAVASLVPKGHKWTVCGCDDCRFVGRVQMNYLAATNRRDLLIEMSFHAHYHSHHGAAVMAWLAIEMNKPVYTINWCAQEMSRYPMERWMLRCEASLSPGLSGAVFIDAAGVTSLTSSIGSSLGNEIAFGGFA